MKKILAALAGIMKRVKDWSVMEQAVISWRPTAEGRLYFAKELNSKFGPGKPLTGREHVSFGGAALEASNLGYHVMNTEC